MKTSRFSAAPAAFLALCIAACGGGGGGGGPVSPPPPPPGGGEPPPPVISYSGNSQPATVDQTNAHLFAAQVLALQPLVALAEGLWINLPATGAIDTTINGAGGGTARVTGNIISATNGYLVIDFQDYIETGVVFDGRSTQRLRSGGPAIPGIIFSEAGPGSIEFDDLSITVLGVELRFRGVISITNSNASRFDIDLMVTEPATGNVAYYENAAFDFSLVQVGGSDRPSIAVSGTVYDSVEGRVQVTPTTPFPDLEVHAQSGVLIAQRGGGFQMESAGGLVEFRSLSRSYGGIMRDVDGDLAFDEGKRFSWEELAGVPSSVTSVMTGPIANPGQDIFADTGQEVSVHALYSHDDDGDWLTFEWRELFKPIGSQVSLPVTQSPLFTFTPDIDGDYLFALRVSDGIETRESTVMVRSDSFSQVPSPAATITGNLEVAGPFQAGAPILVDGRSATNRLYDAQTPGWVVDDGPGTATLADVGDRFTRELTVDADGNYLVYMQETPNLSPIEFIYSDVTVDVGPGAFFDRVVKIVGDFRGREVIAADVSGDGRDDWLVGVASPSGSGFIPFIADGNGGFSEMALVPGAGDGELATGDLNGDGRIDVAKSDGDGAYVSYQSADGSFAAGVLLDLSGGSCIGSSQQGGDIAIGDIDGDGRDDLALAYYCDRTVVTWRQDVNGNLEAPVVQPFTDDVYWGAFDDVDGDNRLDAILGVASSGNPASMLYAKGQVDGTFLFDERFEASSGAVPSTTIGDVNSDGRLDLVMLIQEGVRVYEQQPDGSMTEADFNNDVVNVNGDYATVADIDDDLDADILICRTRDLYIGFRQPDGTYDYSEQGECYWSNSQQTVGVVSDLDGDGRSEFVLPATDLPGAFRNREEMLDVYMRDVNDYARTVN